MRSSERGEAIEQDCSSCANVGTTAAAMLCAVDLCDSAVATGQALTSPTGDAIDTAHAAVARFGDTDNDLGPRLNGSYALLSTGVATAITGHTTDLAGGSAIADGVLGGNIYDVTEWRIHLTAPPGAHGFKVRYVYLSAEYDEWVATEFADRFYIFKSPQGDDAGRQVINFTPCRAGITSPDFTCAAGGVGCAEGDGYCYLSTGSALSDCCWYGACTPAADAAVVSGTGYSCAPSSSVDTSAYGSSTGWLETAWPCVPGEEFDVVFHIHDTADSILDSEVILDAFQFYTSVAPGTVRIAP